MFTAIMFALGAPRCFSPQHSTSKFFAFGMFFLLVAMLVMVIPVDAWATTPPAGPYQQSCRSASISGATLVASCPDYFGNFRNTALPDAVKCQVKFTAATGQVFPRSIRNVDGALRCVITFTPGTGDKAPGFDFISLLSDTTVDGQDVKVWRIDQPTVWSTAKPSGEVDYPIIRFQAGDRLRFNAGGCVQTGGSGSTWKLYLNPQGDNAPQYYAGTAFIKNITSGAFQRIEGLMTQQNNLVSQQASLPPPFRGTLGPLPKDPQASVDYILRLGYQDDNIGDNSYFAHDDGTGNQCQNVGPAFVEVTVISGPPVTGALLSPHSKPFDLVWDMNNDEDENGLPLNPQWNFALENHGVQPRFKPLCGAAFPSVVGWSYPIDFTKLEQICTAMPVSFDLDPKGAECGGDPFPGHMNFAIATYQGQVSWSEWSGFWPNDNDWNFNLVPLHGAGLAGTGDTPAPATAIGMEFDTEDTDLGMPFWNTLLSPPFEGQPVPSIQSVFAGPHNDGLQGVVIGEVGLDGVHGAYSELHPVFAMAVLLNQTSAPGQPENVIQNWAFFLRNFGDEGGCSGQTWHWASPTGDFFVPLGWPDGATDVSVNSANVTSWQAPASPVNIEKDPDRRFTLIHVRAPAQLDEFGTGGTITLQYRIPGGMKKAPPAHKAPNTKESETEIKDLSLRIADPATRAKFAAAMQALGPKLTARSANKIAVNVPTTVTVRKHVPGAASRGKLTPAHATTNAAKLQRNIAIFKLMQTYSKDLKLDVPAQLPIALTPAGAKPITK